MLNLAIGDGAYMLAFTVSWNLSEALLVQPKMGIEDNLRLISFPGALD